MCYSPNSLETGWKPAIDFAALFMGSASCLITVGYPLPAPKLWRWNQPSRQGQVPPASAKVYHSDSPGSHIY